MDLSERECAHVLGLAETAVRRLVKRGELPAARIGDDRRIGRVDLLEWALARGVSVPPDLFAARGDTGLGPALLRGALVGPSADWREALAALPFPDRLRAVLEARLGRTIRIDERGVGLPRPRAPLILPVDAPRLYVASVASPQPIAGGPPASIALVVVCPDVRTHLAVTSRLATALGDAAVVDALRSGGDREIAAALLEARGR